MLAGVPQVSIMGSLLFLIYINDLPKDLSSKKLFADDTSIFSTVQDIKHSTDQLNRDLDLISKWAHQWTILFNPDPQKQTQEVMFSRKTIKAPHLSVVFNNFSVVQSSCQKHLGVYLDQKLNFTHHIKEKVTKANKGIAVIKKLQTKLPRNALLTIYKFSIRSHLDYADIIYDQPNNNSFKNKLERIQYNAALAVT